MLPMVDVGLMDEHLSGHEGLLFKLKNYEAMVKETMLNNIIQQEIIVLKDHIRAMLQLLDPENKEWVSLKTDNPSFEVHPISAQSDHELHQLKKIVMELKTTVKHMANENYTSALMMKNPNVKHVHFQMAMQQATFQNYFAHIMKLMDWEYTPKAAEKEQKKVIQKFEHLLD
ncbi:hypothetical protein [Aquibacillus albus]|uniref:Spore coat protein n=1 Tax=Aquibacillus albus TaxID=1168171 RepID=A0ABS2N2V5_9BACI|nr:hypothetical protein [Aquibacillus albus]MBM7572457.1 hypothetical protein [Aquibacillus albus]